jgi:hypothetical protein
VTLHEVLTTARAAGILLEAHGNRLLVEAPKGVLTAEFADVLSKRKAELLPILERLQAMRQHGVDFTGRGPEPPVPVAKRGCGGPGHCFSCGDPLEYSEAYGRCGPCDLAAEAFFALRWSSCERDTWSIDA